MKTYSRHLALLILCITVLAAQIGCDTGAVITVSDVPCFQPIAWSPGGGGGILTRTIPDFEGAILITRQTSAQIEIDRNDGDGMETFFPHDPVYRFSPETGVTDLVDDSDWDSLTTRITDCLAPPGSDEPFGLGGGARPTLLFDGEEISVAGGAAVRIESAPISAVAAVVSTSGSFPIIPFTFGTSTGQHYHQLFSRLDGSPIGKAVRLGVGLSDLCWTFEEEYVTYFGGNSNSERTICIVPIEDNLPQFGN